MEEPELRRIGVDIDGVLADSIPFIGSWLRQRFPEVTLADVLQLHTPGRETYSSYFDRYEDRIYRELPAMPGARRGLQQLSRFAEVHVISARTPRVQAATEAWLRANDLLFDSLQMLCGGDKGAVARSLGLDAFVEDQVHNATAILAAGTPVVLMAAPYNAHFHAPGVSHARGWGSAVRQVSGLLWNEGAAADAGA